MAVSLCEIPRGHRAGVGVECHVARESSGHHFGARVRFGGVGQRSLKTISQTRQLSRLYAFRELFHDRHLCHPDAGGGVSSSVDVGTFAGDCGVRGAGLVALALRIDAAAQGQVEARIVPIRNRCRA